MSKEARLAAGLERVKRWKADKKAHGYSLSQQGKRRYLRKKAAQTKVRVEAVKERERKEPLLPRYGETYLEHPALTDGDAPTVWEHARNQARRRGVAVPPGLMEPEQEGGHVQTMGQSLEPGLSEKDLGGPTSKTPEEARVAQWLKEKRRPKGVRVELKA